MGDAFWSRDYHQSRDYVNPVRAHGLKADIEKKPELADIVAKIP